MENRKFGNTGLRINKIGIGTYGHGDAYGTIKKKESIEIFEKAIDHFSKDGPFIIDTAPRYGNGKCEEWLGEVLNNNMENVFIATKGGREISKGRVNMKNFSNDFIARDLFGSLKRLKIEKIFLYQLHNPSIDFLKTPRLFELLEKFRKEQLIDYYGVSIDNPIEGISLINYCKNNGFDGLASIQLIYNVLNKSAEQKLFKFAFKNKVAIIAREPLLRGYLANSNYNHSNDWDNVFARKKIIDQFGYKQIKNNIEAMKNLIIDKKILGSLFNIALGFATSNNLISVTIPGIHRIEHLDELIKFKTFKSDIDKMLFLKHLSDLTPI